MKNKKKNKILAIFPLRRLFHSIPHALGCVLHTPLLEEHRRSSCTYCTQDAENDKHDVCCCYMTLLLDSIRVAYNLPGCISKLCTIPFITLSSPGAYLLRAALPFNHSYYQRYSHGMLVVVVVVVVIFIHTEHPSLNFELTLFFGDMILGLSKYRVLGRSKFLQHNRHVCVNHEQYRDVNQTITCVRQPHIYM